MTLTKLCFEEVDIYDDKGNRYEMNLYSKEEVDAKIKELVEQLESSLKISSICQGCHNINECSSYYTPTFGCRSYERLKEVLEAFK